jgi:hypothetical protein
MGIRVVQVRHLPIADEAQPMRSVRQVVHEPGIERFQPAQPQTAGFDTKRRVYKNPPDQEGRKSIG